eukprot:TRINITY_DN25980_c0_g1_i1.p1 TRINITY_DN25980_c0_g1~~TRINITY_DN25980_c0_g1_i1.p1  ORF type:complete len:102 (+),score=42.45 TRINITY_DN25980_c0_g1_i1:13-318(+)
MEIIATYEDKSDSGNNKTWRGVVDKSKENEGGAYDPLGELMKNLKVVNKQSNDYFSELMKQSGHAEEEKDNVEDGEEYEDDSGDDDRPQSRDEKKSQKQKS